MVEKTPPGIPSLLGARRAISSLPLILLNTAKNIRHYPCFPAFRTQKQGVQGGQSTYSFQCAGRQSNLNPSSYEKYGVKNNTSRINKLIPHSYHINYR